MTDLGECFIYKGDITFRRRLKLALDTGPDILNITCRLEYQVCDEELCLPPKRVTLVARVNTAEVQQ